MVSLHASASCALKVANRTILFPGCDCARNGSDYSAHAACQALQGRESADVSTNGTAKIQWFLRALASFLWDHF